MLDIRGLAASINDKPILNGIDLTVPSGRGSRRHGPERIG